MTKHWSSRTGADSSTGAPPERISTNSPPFPSSTLKARAEAASRATSSATRDDSGVINLKALIAQADEEKAAEEASAPNVTAHIPVYPFGAPVDSPLTPSPGVQPATFTKPEAPPPRKRSRRGRAGGVAIAAALLSIAAVAAAAVGVGLNALEVPRAAVATPAPTAIQWAMTPAPAAPEPEEVAVKQPSSTEEEQAAPALSTPRPAMQIPHVAQAPVLNKTAEAPPTVTAPPAQPAKPENDPCKGDLMCAMQRAVKK